MYTVKKIDKKTANEIIPKIHYSKKLGIFWEGFALYENDKIIGVVCYGQPSASIQKHCFLERNFRLYELTRLVVDGGKKNAASFLISHSLKMLSQQPCAVISYADSSHGHAGIVYQSTNWIYTGGTVSHDHLYIIDGVLMHPTSVQDKFKITSVKKWAKDNNIQTIKPDINNNVLIYFQSGAGYVTQSGLKFSKENKMAEVSAEEANLLLRLQNFRLPSDEEKEVYYNSQEG